MGAKAIFGLSHAFTLIPAFGTNALRFPAVEAIIERLAVTCRLGISLFYVKRVSKGTI
jgi:hypothetical protein